MTVRMLWSAIILNVANDNIMYLNLGACVNFTQNEYTVIEESGVVQICIEVFGKLEDSVSVKLFTISGTAEGNGFGHYCSPVEIILFIVISTAMLDYTPTQEFVMFEESGTMCVNISISQMDTAEDTESFLVALTALEGRVEVKQSWVPVIISDSDS